jgi:hypothetical protein
MTRPKNIDANLHATAIAPWDDEGGASKAPQRRRKSKIPAFRAVNR